MMMKLLSSSPVVVVVLLLVSLAPQECLSLSQQDASATRGKLLEAFSSPSGKLTYSPEIVIPEPSDATAILLQANAIQGLSSKIRASKANALFLKGSMTALQTLCVEQEASRGSFPGPVPAIYVPGHDGESDFEAIAEAGADGMLISICSGKEVSSAQDLSADSDDDSSWIEACQAALKCGVQPIPEVTLSESAVETIGEDGMEALVDSLCSSMGEDPVAVLVTVNPTKSESNSEENDDSDEEEKPVSLPTIPKSLGKRVPILGSVRAHAGDNRLGIESARFKESGFTGAFLRSECVPGFRVQLDLDIVGKFWAGCITDLKSTKSKSFSFRSKNNMEKNMATQWGNYQKSVIESGALGDPNESYSVVDEAAGEYKGFA